MFKDSLLSLLSLLILGKIVVMAHLGLLIYLLVYPDRFFEGFWINMQMDEMHRTFFFQFIKKAFTATVVI